MLDHFAEWAWVVGDYCRPMSERVWAGAKGVGTAAFLAFGGEAAGRVGGKLISALGDAAEMGGEETFRIIDGVRRAKAADMLGHDTIPAEIFDAETGASLGTRDLPIDSLRSPKDVIDLSRQVDMDRWQNVYNLTKSGSVPPP